MITLTQLSTKNKLVFGYSIIISSIIILAIVSYFSITRINKLNKEIFQLDHISSNLIQLRSDANRLTGLAYQFMYFTDAESKKHTLDLINAKEADVVIKLAHLDSTLLIYPQQLLLFNKINTEFDQFLKNENILVGMVNSGKTQEIIGFIKNVQDPLYESLHSKTYALGNQLKTISKQHDKENDSLILTIDYLLIILSLSIIGISIFLATSMLSMLKRISMEMRNGVTVLGTSSSEILTTVTEISTGAAETATSVSETTTTVEEVRQTAMVSNQKAQSLMMSSQKAADSVEKGRESINEVTLSMKKIENQMNLISDTVLKLAEQNRTIGEITSSVADIADQSNLLAVNAAIEAAKAGEHGRGFTVVAQEIRSLADQSKKATAQVKEILNEINKSVNQAVGVTEQGSRTVEEGRKLVAQSGDVIELLADNVEETAQASIQISSSNQQQMAGMEQIVPAMENIKLASQQNVTGIKQAQAAAHDLNTLGQNLKETIEKFKI
jgi:methyl-accepting chemotaxis protein